MKRRAFIIISALLLIIFSSFISFTFVKAQSLDLSSGDSSVPGVNEQVDIGVSPQNPAPNSPVSITLADYSTDLSRADISWLVNGKVEKNGIGATEFDLTTGNSGASINIGIIIQPASGNKIERQVIITPASVDITWETDSYTPPFYKGKALYPPEGNLIFVALPNIVKNGVSVDSKNLVYTWSVDGTVLGSDSGYGKNTLTYKGTELDRPFTVDVTASSLDNSVTGVGEIIMQSEDPQVLFYENNPLYGVLFNRALANNYTLQSDEVQVTAYPFNFSATTPNDSSLQYSWNINDNPISVSQNQNAVTFRKTAGQSGESSISLSLSNPVNFLQSAADNLVINF